MSSNLHPVMQQALTPFLKLPQSPGPFDDAFASLLKPKPKKPKPAHYHIILAHALYDLNVKVNEGGEFPDKAYDMAQRYGVQQTDLENLYDAQFET